MMAKVRMEDNLAVKMLQEEQRARVRRSRQYDEEVRRNSAFMGGEMEEEPENAFMATTILTPDDELIRSIQHDDLFDLEDPALEAEIRRMSPPIDETVVQLREMQRVADVARDSMSPEREVEGWFTVGPAPTPAFGVAEPLANRRSKRIQTRAVIREGTDVAPMTTLLDSKFNLNCSSSGLGGSIPVSSPEV